MGGHLTVVFLIVVAAVEVLADAGVGAEHVALAIKLKRDAVSMLVVAQAAVERCHEVVALVHARALHEPRGVGRVEQWTHIVPYQ